MTKTRSIIRNVIYRYYRAVSFSDNNMELLRGEASKLHLSFLKLKICIVFNRFCYLNGFINILPDLLHVESFNTFSQNIAFFTPRPMISQSISFFIIKNDC